MPTSPAEPDELTDLRFSLRAGPGGEKVAVRSSTDATAVVVWSDGSSATDLYDTLPDVLMLGWVETSHEAGDANLDVEHVRVGTVNLTGHWEAYVSDTTGEVYQLSIPTVVAWLEKAMTSLITTGVAYEATHPDDTDDQPTDDQPPGETA